MELHEAITEARENIAANYSTEPCVLIALLAEIDRLERGLARVGSERVAFVERENAELREDKALLDAFDLAGRQDDVRAHQISEDECEPELLGHFWQTPTVQSSSCRDAIRAAIGTQP